MIKWDCVRVGFSATKHQHHWQNVTITTTCGENFKRNRFTQQYQVSRMMVMTRLRTLKEETGAAISKSKGISALQGDQQLVGNAHMALLDKIDKVLVMNLSKI
jgi:hypothetical protein